MATFSDSIRLIDEMTPILRQIQAQTMITANATEMLQNTVADPVTAAAFEGMNQQLVKSAQEMEHMLGQMDKVREKQPAVESGFERWKQNIMAINQGLQLVQNVAGMTNRVIHSFTDAANESITAQTRLNTIASMASGADAAQLTHLKAVAAEYSKITTFSDSALISGMSELATYRLSADALEAMTGTLADYAAGQSGIATDSRAMVQLANQLGKALDGNYGGLTKIGFAFTDAQKEIIDTGTEMERVAVLTQIIAESYGGLAEAMRSTPEGRVQALANAWGSVRTEIGYRLLPAIDMVNQAQLRLTDALSSDAAESFFGAIYTGAQMAGMAISFVVDAVTGVIQWFQEGSSASRVLFYTVIGAGAAFAVSALWSVGGAAVASAHATIAAWLPAAAPFIAIGLIGASVITTLQDMGYTAEDIAGTIGSVFYTMGMGVQNVFAGIANAFIWIANKASSVGAYFGIGEGEQFDYKKLNDLEDFKKGWEDGGRIGKYALQGLEDALTFTPFETNPNQGNMPMNIDTVDEINRINNPVNLAEEDLRYILDERERRYIANVNLSAPAPTVTLVLENVNNVTDLDSFMDQAGKKLREMSEANIVIVPT